MGILEFVFPKKCIECGTPGKYICNGCVRKQVKAIPVCPYCRRYSYGGKTHPSCMKKGRIDGVYSLWRHEGAMRKAIHKLKYTFNYDLCGEICNLFVNGFDRRMFEGKTVLVTPVPLSPKRERWRGFNQAEILGKRICLEVGWDFKETMGKKEQRKNQVGLNRDERQRNVKGVYGVKGVEVVKRYEVVVVFDDVTTTGATLIEAGEMLKKVGVQEVWGMTIAS